MYDQRSVEVDITFLIFREQHCFFHEVLPGKVPLRLHMLEKHTTSWLREWGPGVAFGRNREPKASTTGSKLVQ